MFLWSAHENPDRARDDLREAMRLARQVGHPGPERVATYNLAEDLYWSGQDDEEAFALAQRARELAADHIERKVPEDALLVARTALAADKPELAREAVDWVAQNFALSDLSLASRCFHRMIELVLQNAELSAWQSLLLQAAELSGDDLLELHYWMRRSGHRLEGDLEPLLERYPIWQGRFGEVP
jgi:hypothetical protein